MATQEQLRSAGATIADVAAAWQLAYGSWVQAVQDQHAAVERAERRIRRATGGRSLARWEAVCRRRTIHTVDEAKDKALALRARPAVAAAVGERDRLAAALDAVVLAARIELAAASRALSRYGTVGACLVGIAPGELARLARRPRSAISA
ncbi:MAG: hypothetical protein M0Z30_07635 [Actinomycetota bacterium]|nr:hypothetical protein [Actinomycetota bacterium]